MRKLFVIAVAVSLGMPITAKAAQSALSCPSGFQVGNDINRAFCIAFFNFKDGSCPSGSKLFTMDGKPLCLHSQSPKEDEATPVSRTEPIPVTPRLTPN